MLTDFKFALRKLLKSPGFTSTALAILALCLGANLTIFTVVDSILIRSLPYPGANRLVVLYNSYPKANIARDLASLTSYYERRGNIAAFSSLSAIGEATSVVGETGATSIENVGRVTPEFFATLAVAPFMGRGFGEEEMTYQTDHVAMISYEQWRSKFNSDPNVLEKWIRLDGIPRRIVGVLPVGFRFLSFQAPVYTPLSSEEAERNLNARHANNVIEIARLAPQATLADAQAQIDAHNAAHAAELPQAKIIADAGFTTHVAFLHVDHVASVRPTLLLLQAGAAFLLLIGAVNLANLLLARASSRSREVSIRQALGANYVQLVREVMAETILLALSGALLGLIVGAIGIKLLALFGADQLPLGNEIRLDVREAVLSLIVALVTALCIGAPIAWFNLHGGLARTLHSESRGSTTSRGAMRLRQGLIVAQISLAFVLLSGAGLLGMSLKRAMSVSPGFRPDHLITGKFNLTWKGYPNLPAFLPFFDQLQEKVSALPGISAVGVISNLPVSSVQNISAITIPGHPVKPGESIAAHAIYTVAGDYFKAMGIPLRAGRVLTSADAHGDALTCVVDEPFARQYWPDGDAVGKQIYRGVPVNADDKPFTIIGVVGAVKQSALTEKENTGAIYFPCGRSFVRNYFLVARTALPPETFSTTLPKTIRQIDPELPLTDLRAMDVRINDSLATRRSPALLASIFAGTALLLASIGLYGVMAYSVSQRVREFGIRLALGAQRGNVLRLVFGQGMRLTIIGLALGVTTTGLLTDYMSSMLYGVKPNDPNILIGIASLLAVIAAIACWLPARRATQVDPMIALRAE